MDRHLFLFFTVLGFCVLKKAECGVTMEQVEKFAAGMRKSCLSKVPIDPQLADNAKKGDFSDDPDFKCYARCIVKTTKGIKNGKIDEPMLVAQMSMYPVHSDRMIAAVKKCSSVTADNECELAYRFLQCSYEADPEIFYFP